MSEIIKTENLCEELGAGENNAEILSAAIKGLKDGDTLELPAGHFLINGSLELKDLSDVKIKGYNTYLAFEGEGSPIFAESCEKLLLKGIVIDCGIPNVPAIALTSCKNTTLEDITIRFATLGIVAEESENINVYRLFVKPVKGDSISTEASAFIFNSCCGKANFHTCYFEGLGGNAIKNISENIHINFECSAVKNCLDAGLILNGGSALIRNNLFKNCSGSGVYLEDASDCVIDENRFIDCDTDNEIKSVNSQNISIKDNIIIGSGREVKDNISLDAKDIFKINPAVFAVGKQYHIMQPIETSCTYGIKIGDKIYYDETNGVMRSGSLIHKVEIPMEALDNAGEYTVIIREVSDRVHNTPLVAANSIEKIYKFKAIPSENAKCYYIADSHNYMVAPIKAAHAFGEIDFLILNGDLQCHCSIEEDFLLPFYIASELTHGLIPIVFGSGNHETLGRLAEIRNDYTPNKNGKTYFTFTLGNIWGMILDGGCDHADDFREYSGTMQCELLRERQIDFIRDVIKNADNEYEAEGVKRRLIICHVPFARHITGKPHEGIAPYGIWQDLIEENIKPQLLISGHTHKYAVHREHCDFPLIIASRLNGREGFGGTGFIFSRDKITAQNTDATGNIGEEIAF